MYNKGYGFLSESPEFAEAVINEGMIFIGPNKDGMLKMGDKLESKRIAEMAGLNCIPGYNGTIRDYCHAQEIGITTLTKAKKLSYPVMIKALAGGGGKGMRIVWYLVNNKGMINN
jgi:propionyl-CoA carboxylase alpha chain